MKRRIYWSMCLIATLILSFIAYEGALVLGTTPSGDNQTSSNALLQKKILTPEEVEKMFPNLPSAAELWNRTYRAIVPSSIGVENATWFNVPDFWHGGIIPSQTSIWLKYNETIWITADFWIAVLDIENLTSAQSSASSSEPRVNARTWALGIYANPGEIAGGQPVEGAISFGSWSTWSGTPDMYIGADVLTIYDGVYGMQIAEAAIMHSDYKYVAVEITPHITPSLLVAFASHSPGRTSQHSNTIFFDSSGLLGFLV